MVLPCMYLAFMGWVHHPMICQEYKEIHRFKAQDPSLHHYFDMGEIIDSRKHPILALEDKPALWGKYSVNLGHSLKIEIPQIFDSAHQFPKPFLERGARAGAGHEGGIKNHRPQATVLERQSTDIGGDHSRFPGHQIETEYWPGNPILFIKTTGPKSYIRLDRPGMQGHDVCQNFTLIIRNRFNYRHGDSPTSTWALMRWILFTARTFA